jgi:transmembrane sensor
MFFPAWQQADLSTSTGRPKVDEIVLRYLDGTATDVERHRVEKWRRAAPENETQFCEIEAIWEGLGHVTSRHQGVRPDAASFIDAAERRRKHLRARRTRSAVLRSPWFSFGAAAAAVLVGIWAWPGDEVQTSALSSIESTVGAGQVIAMILSDGSYLRMAPGTRVEFPAEASRREVVMEGRAFFAVASGTGPFVVCTSLGEITVQGTRFEVRTEEGLLRVVVVEGVVWLAGSHGRVEVHPGQMATVFQGGEPQVTTVGDVWPLLDWPGGLLAFQRTPLRDVASQLARHFHVDVQIRDSLVAANRVTGSFQDTSLDEVVSAVCAVTGIRCDHQGDVVVLGAQAP